MSKWFVHMIRPPDGTLVKTALREAERDTHMT